MIIMQTCKLSLSNHSKFHFGNASGGLKDHFSSDQLVAALINDLMLLYGEEEAERFIQSLKEDHVKFSSVFYGLTFESGSYSKDIYFLPVPRIDLIHPRRSGAFTYKQLKKLSYVSVKLYQSICDSWNPEDGVAELDPDSLQFIGGTFALLADEVPEDIRNSNKLHTLSFARVHITPGVEVGRMTHQSEHFFYQEELELVYEQIDSFRIKPFFFFICKGSISRELQAAIHFLADEGIGGKRSTGKGFFKKVEFNDAIQLPHKGDLYMTLSAYLPGEEEVEHLHSYNLEKRNGFIYSQGGKTIRKKSVMVCAEGSLIKKNVMGKWMNVGSDRIEHPVFFYGKPILVGFGGNGV